MHLAQEPERVVITIDDDGPGVPASQRDRGRGQGAQGTSEDPPLPPAPTASAPEELAGLLCSWRSNRPDRHRRRGRAGTGAAKPSFSGGNGATSGNGARPATHTPPSRPPSGRNSAASPGHGGGIAWPALISSEKAVRSPIPLTRGPGQRLRAVPSGGPRPATNIA